MNKAKERPILFSTPMVRAILEGRKTQTRRTIKPQFIATDGITKITPHDLEGERFGFFDEFQEYRCPYGHPGDKLWVRESWQHSNHPFGPLDTDCDIFFRADYWDDPHGMDGEKSPEGKYRKWKPSIHLPRWASRINLEITGIRVERLQDISEEDAIAEGAKRFDNIPVGTPRPYRNGPDRWSMENPPDTDHCLSTARWAFANFFEKINGNGEWDKNSWCWVIEFKRV